MFDKLSGIFSQQKNKNAINFLKDILENNNIDKIDSINNMIKEFDDINNRSSITCFLHNFSRRYPEIMGAEPIPKSEIDEKEKEH